MHQPWMDASAQLWRAFMQEIGNGTWGTHPQFRPHFPSFCHRSDSLRANCFWRVINRECRFNLAHLSHLFSPGVGTDWKTRHQWIFTQLVFKAKPGQPTNVDWTTPQAPPLPKKEKQVFCLHKKVLCGVWPNRKYRNRNHEHCAAGTALQQCAIRSLLSALWS